MEFTDYPLKDEVFGRISFWLTTELETWVVLTYLKHFVFYYVFPYALIFTRHPLRGVNPPHFGNHWFKSKFVKCGRLQ